MGPMGQTTGITWAEMALSWCFFNRCYLPFKRKDQWGCDKMVQPGNYSDAKEWGTSLSEMGSSCHHLVEHVQSIMVESLTPKLATGKCSSCYIQGFRTFYQGIKMRPVIPFQAEVVRYLQSQLNFGPRRFLDIVPELQKDETNYICPEGFAECYRRSTLAMIRTRKRRRANGGA